MIRLVLADDEHLVRSGLRTVLERDPELVVVAEADDGVAAIAAVREHQPDVALLDVRMPGLDGIAATARLAADHEVSSRLVVLTTFDDDELLTRALRAGALGYLLKSMPPVQLTAAVHTAAAGDVLLAPRLLQRVLSERLGRQSEAAQAAALRAKLSPRELDVLLLVAQGLSNDEVAERLVVAPATVKSHISSLLDKLGVRDRVQLVVLAFSSGLARPAL